MNSSPSSIGDYPEENIILRVPESEENSKQICYECHQPGTSLLDVNGYYFHEEHFLCHICKCNLYQSTFI